MGSVPPHSRNLLFFLLASCILFQPFASANNSNEVAWLSVDASQGSAQKIPQTLFGVFFEVNLTLLSPFWYTRIIHIILFVFSTLCALFLFSQLPHMCSMLAPIPSSCILLSGGKKCTSVFTTLGFTNIFIISYEEKLLF